MKFPRNAKILRSHFDVAPFAAVFFLLLIFLMLGALIPTAGIPLQPPVADNLPGTDRPTVAMAVDASGNLYYDNQIVSEKVLINQLIVADKTARSPLTLLIHADQAVSYQTLVHLALLARHCGITNAWLATLPAVEPAVQP
ncbi:MAG: biopolymer transporter ExbD [Verrucomicrobiota bacterium]|jgi:biopolymer transport protein ExbD